VIPAEFLAIARTAFWLLSLTLGGVGVALVALGWWFGAPMLMVQGGGCLVLAMWIERSGVLAG
jgi:hypothetical protein